MVEKPLALTVEECLAMGEAVRRSKAKLMTAFKMRYYDMLLKAKAVDVYVHMALRFGR